MKLTVFIEILEVLALIAALGYNTIFSDSPEDYSGFYQVMDILFVILIFINFRAIYIIREMLQKSSVLDPSK